MITDRKATGRAKSIPMGLAIGWVVSMALTLTAAVILTYLVLNETMQESVIGAAGMVVLPLSAALGALTSASMVKRRWMQICIGAGGIYFLTLLGMTALFFGGQYSGVGVSALLIFCAVAVVGALGLKGEKRPTKNKKFRHYG